MTTFTRSQECVDVKKMTKLLRLHANLLKSDDTHRDEDVLLTMKKKQQNNHYFPMYKSSDKGRQHCKTGYGALSRKVRNYLADGIYFDVDMVNCSYNTMSAYGKSKGLPVEKIEHYLNNREESLEKMMTITKCNRDIAKQNYTKKWFSYSDPKTSNKRFMKGSLNAEIHKIQTYILKNEDLKEIMKKCRTKPNPQNSALAYFYHEKEWEQAVAAMTHLRTQGYTVAADLHDGFFVKIQEKDNFKESLESDLIKMNKILQESLKMNTTFEIKPMKDILDVPSDSVQAESIKKCKDADFDMYLKIKEKFEKRVCKLTHESKFILEDEYRGDYTLKSKGDIVISFEDYCSESFAIFFGNKPKPFIDNWMKDPHKRTYRTIDFRPNREACPQDVYNSFKGFEIENKKADTFSSKDNDEFQTILDHFKFITDDGTAKAAEMYEYVLDWYADMFQNPENKIPTCLIYKSSEGCGKGIIFTLFKTMLGANYTFTSADPAGEIFGNFNSVATNKILINLDEAEKKQTSTFYEKLKKFITDETVTHKEKFVAEREVQNFARINCNTNNDNSIKISASNRRMVLIECIHDRKSKSDFQKTINVFTGADRKSHILFYKFLMERDIKGKDFQQFPKSNLYMKQLETSAKPIISFLDHMMGSKHLFTTSFKGCPALPISKWFHHYKAWCLDTNTMISTQKNFKADLTDGHNTFKESRNATGILLYFEEDDMKNYLVRNGCTPIPDFEPDSDDDSAF